MEKDDYTWKIHWQDWNELLAVSPLNKEKENFLLDRDFTTFFENLENGTLPNYTYLIPKMYWIPFVSDEEKGMPEFSKYAPNT